MKRHKTGDSVITLTWTSRCHSCGLLIGAGQEAIYRVPPAVYGEVPRWKPTKPTIHHLDVGMCGSEYKVAAVFMSSRIATRVTAYNAQHALEEVAKTFKRKRHAAQPDSYLVYQGNILVLAQSAPPQAAPHAR